VGEVFDAISWTVLTDGAMSQLRVHHLPLLRWWLPGQSWKREVRHNHMAAFKIKNISVFGELFSSSTNTQNYHGRLVHFKEADHITTEEKSLFWNSVSAYIVLILSLSV